MRIDEVPEADEVKEKSVTQDVYLKRLTQVEQENDSLRSLVENLAERLGRTEAFIEILGYDPDYETGEVKTIPKDAKPLTAEEKEAMRKAK